MTRDFDADPDGYLANVNRRCDTIDARLADPWLIEYCRRTYGVSKTPCSLSALTIGQHFPVFDATDEFLTALRAAGFRAESEKNIYARPNKAERARRGRNIKHFDAQYRLYCALRDLCLATLENDTGE
jgi:hypothetical protein